MAIGITSLLKKIDDFSRQILVQCWQMYGYVLVQLVEPYARKDIPSDAIQDYLTQDYLIQRFWIWLAC